jgi:hypothetical protein
LVGPLRRDAYAPKFGAYASSRFFERNARHLRQDIYAPGGNAHHETRAGPREVIGAQVVQGRSKRPQSAQHLVRVLDRCFDPDVQVLGGAPTGVDADRVGPDDHEADFSVE